MPKRFDISMAALSQYTIPRVPPESIWIDRAKSRSPKPDADPVQKPSPSPPTEPGVHNEPPAVVRPARRPPSRRLVRHVLKARVQAVKALAGFFDHLNQAGNKKKVKAAVHLAFANGGGVDPSGDGDDVNGWRYAGEVITFLKGKGAKIPTLGQKPSNGEWAALSSDGEGYTPEEKGEPTWVPSQH